MNILGIKNSGEIRADPDFVQPVVLSSGSSAAQAFDTPAGAGYVAFSFNTDIWVRYGSTAATPPTTTSTGSSGSELNPTIRNIGSTLSCTGISIASDTPGKGCLIWASKP